METVIQNTITNHKIMLDQHSKAIVGSQEMLSKMNRSSRTCKGGKTFKC